MLRLIPAGLAHTSAIGAIQARCFEDPWSERSVADVLVSPGAFGYMAVTPNGRSDIAVGYVIARVSGDDAELLSLGVAPEQRRAGVAKRLIDEVLRIGALKGVRRLYLEVAEDNAPAQMLYSDYGFVQVGRREGYYRRSQGVAAALTMCRML
jgi:ribosomal-protein-alanine N-acetyltransferase